MATFLHKLVLASAMATSVISPAAAQTLFALTFPLEMPFWTSPPAVYDNAPSGYIRSGMRLCAISGVVTAHNLKFRQLIIANGQTIYIDASEGYPGGARDPANDRKCQMNAALYAKQSNPQYARVFGSSAPSAPPSPDIGGNATANSMPIQGIISGSPPTRVVKAADATSAACPESRGKVTLCLTSVQGEQTGYTPMCDVHYYVANDTSYRIGKIVVSLSSDSFSVVDVRARLSIDSGQRFFSSCAELLSLIKVPSRDIRIERCEISGLSEGDCLDMVAITSVIPAGGGTQADQQAVQQLRNAAVERKQQCQIKLTRFQQWGACAQQNLNPLGPGNALANARILQNCGIQPEAVQSCP